MDGLKDNFLVIISLIVTIVYTNGWAQEHVYNKAEVSNRIEIEGNVDFAWKYLSDLNHLQFLVPSTIKKSITDGSGKGSKVTLTLVNDGTIVEEVVSFDNNKRVISYSMITTPLPIKNYLATFKINAISSQTFEVVFNAEFDVQDVNREGRFDAFNKLQLELLQNLKKIVVDKKL